MAFAEVVSGGAKISMSARFTKLRPLFIVLSQAARSPRGLAPLGPRYGLACT